MTKQTKMRFGICLFVAVSFIGGMAKVYASIPQPSEVKYTDTSIYKETVNEVPTYDIVETTVLEEEKEVETVVVKQYDDETVEVLTNLLYGEARGVKGDDRKSAVVWCVLNRFDNGNYGNTIIKVATAKHQFCGYVAGRVYKDLDSYNHCKEIVIDVLDRYYTEEQVGRTLPKDYLYFVAKNGENVFTKEWKSTNYWNWSLENPYAK